MIGGWHDLLDLFYPRTCVGCGRVLIRTETDLCMSCLLQLPIISNTNKERNLMEERFYGRFDVEDAASFLYYEKETVAQSLLHEIKYRGNKELGKRLGRMFGARIKNRFFADVDGIIPVPLHANKMKSRGYNQSEWIAKGIAEAIEKPVWTDVLVRIVENATQTRKNAYERWENVKGIFRLLDKRDVEGKHLLIVDDVMTTGATMEACIAPFRDMKNVKISVATLAIVD